MTQPSRKRREARLKRFTTMLVTLRLLGVPEAMMRNPLKKPNKYHLRGMQINIDIRTKGTLT